MFSQNCQCPAVLRIAEPLKNNNIKLHIYYPFFKTHSTTSIGVNRAGCQRQAGEVIKC